MQLEQKHIDRLKLGYPNAKYFVHMTLKGDKEITFTIDKGSSLSKGIKANVAHLKSEYGYTDSEIETETYDLRGDK